MIYSVRGTLIAKEAGLAVVECGGVGYACRTTYNTLAALGNTGSEVMLYTDLHVREDGAELFGFADKGELGCFRLLLSVTGVGPKAALAILSDTDPNSFALAVATGNHKQLTKTKGIGPKLAQRIVLELKDKLAKGDIGSGAETFTVKAGGGAPAAQGAMGEAADALMVLGYTRGEADSALAGEDPSLSAEELIKTALKKLSKFK